MEEARKKLEDYEKVSKVHRTLTADNVVLERELAALNTRLEEADKARKNEIAVIKTRYEAQMNTMRDELKSLHNQVPTNVSIFQVLKGIRKKYNETATVIN